MTDNWWIKLTEMHEEAKKEYCTGHMSAETRVRMNTLMSVRETLAEYAKQEGLLK